MAKKTETAKITPAEAVRKGWLAYLGLYGAAFERVKPMTEKYADVFETLVAKGANVEANAQEVAETVRERATGIYGENVERFRKFVPSVVARKSRVEELEAEVEALNKKVEALTKKPAAKRATKAKAA